MKLKPYTCYHGKLPDGVEWKNFEPDPVLFERGWNFFCPGCQQPHSFRIHVPVGVAPRPDGSAWPVWTFNGDVEVPTFAPSLLYSTENGKWVDDTFVPNGTRTTNCHLFLTNGQLQYLADCQHTLAGQTVPLPEWPEKGQ